MKPFVSSHAAFLLATCLMTLSLVGCRGDAAGDSRKQRNTPDADAGVEEDTSPRDTAFDDVAVDVSVDTSDTKDTPDSESAEDVAPDTASGPMLAADIEISGIQAFQTIETKLVEDGAPVTSDVPLVVGRDTLFRVAVTPTSTWSPREVTAELELVDENAGQTVLFSKTMTVNGTSTPDVRDSSFEFRVSGEKISTATAASFRLLGDGSMGVEATSPTPARWPQDGSMMPLEATDEPGELHVVIVPFRWDTDGSGRLPDTSAQQIALFEEALRALYPASELRLEVREAISWTSRVDWGDFNIELRSLKQSDRADDAYYYGLVKPADTFSQYCGGRCTTGQSFTVSSAESTSYRVGAGLGFSGERWAWTLVHELGHMHGRGHAPCGVSWWSEDRSYPYAESSIGVRGWDSRTDTMYAHDDVTDFMGYCEDLWASDYTYLGILERMRQANARIHPMSLVPESTWRYINWNETSAPEWGPQTRERDPSTGEWARAVFTDAAGNELARRRVPLLRYAHHGERSVLVPQAPNGSSSVEIRAFTKRFSLALP